MNANIGLLSDIHGGHSRTDTEFIHVNLEEVFDKNVQALTSLDYLILSGDTYDKLLIKGSKDDVDTTEMIIYLIMFCVNNKIKMRWLRGTISHDGKQAESVVKMIEKLGLDIDFKYFDTVTYIKEDDGVDFIYIPDEVNEDATKTMKLLTELMSEHSLDKVDFIIMHGQYDYQLPVPSIKSFDVNFMSKLVRHRIFSGHIHKHSIVKKVVSVGSFDRLAHNEEEKKGMLVYRDGLVSQLVNHNAKTFKTFKVGSDDIARELEVVKRKLDKLALRDDSYISIKNDGFVIDGKILVKQLRVLYPTFNFTYNAKTIKKELKKKVHNFKTFSISPDNIEELLRKRLTKKVDKTTAEQVVSELLRLG